MTTTFTCAPASFDARFRGHLDGIAGSTRMGAPWIGPDSYVYWTQDDGTGRQVGFDPAVAMPELDGLDPIVVELDAAPLTGAQVAAATRAIVPGASGSGADVVLPGTWSRAGVAFGARGVSSARGNRNALPAGFNDGLGGPNNVTIATHLEAGGEDALAVGMSVYLGNVAPGELAEVSLWIGGDENDFTPAALYGAIVFETIATGHHVLLFTPDLVDVVTAGASLWCLTRGTCAQSAPGFNSTPEGSDLTDRQLLVLDLNADPNVALPATLAGVNPTGQANLRQLVSVQFVRAPFKRAGGYEVLLGAHGSVLLTSPSQSDFTGVDPLGANVGWPVRNPDVLELRRVAQGMGYGTGLLPVRLYTREGGATDIDPTGAANMVDGGLTSGAVANSFCEVTGGAGELLTPGEITRLQVCGNGGGSIRFAAWDSDLANDPGNPHDFLGGANSEYETNTANVAHSTNPNTVPADVQVTIGVGPGLDQRPGNIGAMYLRAQVAPDTVQVASSGGASNLMLAAMELLG